MINLEFFFNQETVMLKLSVFFRESFLFPKQNIRVFLKLILSPNFKSKFFDFNKNIKEIFVKQPLKFLFLFKFKSRAWLSSHIGNEKFSRKAYRLRPSGINLGKKVGENKISKSKKSETN